MWVLDSQLERMLSSPERSIARDVANPVSTILDGVTEIHDHEWVVVGALSHASHAIISRMFSWDINLYRKPKIQRSTHHHGPSSKTITWQENKSCLVSKTFPDPFNPVSQKNDTEVSD